MTPTHQLLQMTLEQYHDDVYIPAYIRWCMSVSVTETDLQQVMANSAVNHYYNQELGKCEAEFALLLSDYPAATAADALKLYNRCTFELFNRRCQPLIALAKKTQIIAHAN